ncbi:protein of unknown function [Sterolibacterium denitrificans]|uniref:Uncharacterized protein n=1 Tax=Sterolibacterium denitrificans TaxID=157592 RepID=A0A7Z7HTB4_9PROT|nr:protein of unknown function [Sterolibacterium denitrificans]
MLQADADQLAVGFVQRAGLNGQRENVFPAVASVLRCFACRAASFQPDIDSGPVVRISCGSQNFIALPGKLGEEVGKPPFFLDQGRQLVNVAFGQDPLFVLQQFDKAAQHCQFILDETGKTGIGSSLHGRACGAVYFCAASI